MYNIPMLSRRIIIREISALFGGEKMLGKYVRVKVVKPIGSDDGAGFTYPLNFGTVYGNEKQSAFIMGIHHPVRNFDGRVIAIMSDRKNKKYI